ncbi:hypothetical protein ACROYT_G038090 [Oculina patagonica]
MGVSFSSVLDENERKSDINAIHELYSLERKVCRKLEEQASKLYINALNDECLPIVCAADKKQRLLLNVDSASSDEIRKRISEVLHGDYLEELIKLLAEKLNNVLGNTTTGEQESLFTHVVFANKSVIRIDLFVYHTRFRLSESLCEYKNILAYFVQVGLLDIAKARPQVLIYELTRATDSAKLNDACEKLKAMAKYTARLNYTVVNIAKVPGGNNCTCGVKKEPEGSEQRSPCLLDNLTWGLFGKLMALTITFALCSALTAREYRWWSLSNILFGIRELSKRQLPGLYILYFSRR